MTIEDLEKAVAKLPPDQLAKFRAWFEAFDGARVDEKIGRNAAAGKLDRFAEEALGEFKHGQTRVYEASREESALTDYSALS